jgi:cytochrome c-type biogenesis protein CcmE
MPKKTVRVVLSAAVIVGAVSLLLFTTMAKDAQAYKHVDEIATNPSAWYGKSMQVHGFVAGQIMVRPNTLDYKFDIQNNGHMIHATYTGVVPDTFKTGSEVVLTGRLQPDGFKTEQILAKCPSKYTPGREGGQASVN